MSQETPHGKTNLYLKKLRNGGWEEGQVFELSPGGIISVATTLEYRPGFILP
jgi:hypothetical protein